MPLPTNAGLTKLRLLYYREKRKSDKLSQLAAKQYQKAEVAWSDYSFNCYKLGYCAACERVLSECSCVLLAKNIGE